MNSECLNPTLFFLEYHGVRNQSIGKIAFEACVS
jgi:hypothetical protein